MKIGLIVLFLGMIIPEISAQNTVEMKKEKQFVAKSEQEWKALLTPEQYHVLREKGTERPFTGKYDDFFEQGSYHCAACEALLFSSKSKFKSGCGWPSFSGVAKQENIVFKEDNSRGMQRIEVLCAACGGHLGHVFNDGPPPSYLRYCINSVSVKFVE